MTYTSLFLYQFHISHFLSHSLCVCLSRCVAICGQAGVRRGEVDEVSV